MESADLHVHTTASDGLLNGPQVVAMAGSLGLCAVGITDHDTVMGIEGALRQAKRMSLTVIPGVEISSVFPRGDTTEAPNRTVEAHILGYMIDWRQPALLELLDEMVHHRQQRAKTMVKQLCDHGVEIPLDDVIASAAGGAVGRPHVARILENMGFASDTTDAFDRYLNPGRPGYVNRYKLHPREAASAIRGAGGVPVLAHPGLLRWFPGWDEIKSWGILGLEVRHPCHSLEETCRFRRAARVHGLVPTGGSDFHRPGKPGHELGRTAAPLEWMQTLEEAGGGGRE